jgi:tetratricopeptide (TPR) repeat protein
MRSTGAVLALIAGVFALYAAGLRYPPVFDDVQLTPHFLRSYGESWFRGDLRWFSYATFGWTTRLFGEDWIWQRLGNVMLHAAVAAALFAFLARLFRQVLGQDAKWIAFFGAALFAAHPVAVYGVAYLMQRSIVMATLFSVLALAAFQEGLLRRSRGWHIASALAYFVAVFSKEHSVMLPAVAVALALLHRGASRPLARELALPMVLYAAIAVVVTLKSRGLLGALYEPFAQAAMRQLAEAERAVHGGRLPSGSEVYPLSVMNQALLFFRYLGTWLVPYPGWMSVDVRTTFPRSLASWPHLLGLMAWLAYPALSLALLLRGGRAGLAGFALLSPWLLALTEVATVRLQEPFVLYRSYLWMLCLPAGLAALFGRLPARWQHAALGVALLVLLVPFADRLRSFSSTYALWDDAVRKNLDATAPLVDRAYRNRGVALYEREDYGGALADFDRAIQIDRGSPRAWMVRGTLYMRTAQHERALADFDRALELDPRDDETLGRRCVVLMRVQRYHEALADCLRAAALNPYDSSNYTSLGMVHALRGDAALAEAHYRQALHLDPRSGDAHYQYAVLLSRTGRGVEARPHFNAACGAGIAKACDAASR